MHGPLTVSIISGDRVITKNTLLTKIPHLSRAYSVRFEMNLTSMGTSWTNLIHMTTTDKDYTAVGDRIPVIWLVKDSSSADKIRIQTGTSSVNNILLLYLCI